MNDVTIDIDHHLQESFNINKKKYTRTIRHMGGHKMCIYNTNVMKVKTVRAVSFSLN